MNHWPYLPFLLVWALPIIVVQWLAGGRYLWRERKLWLWIVVGLTLYFSLADAVAIDAGIWSFDNSSLVGISLGPVPIEEILFYLLTATMVVQGFVIAWSAWGEREKLIARWQRRLSIIRKRLTQFPKAS